MCRISVADAGSANVCAFLDMLAFSEIGAKLLSLTDDGYNVLVGATINNPTTFDSYAAHPDKVVTLSATLRSSAAGRYQLLFSTWDSIRRKLNLPDFSPVSQDKAAILLLDQGGALTHIEAGNITQATQVAAAISTESTVWASLPGSPYGQPTNSMTTLLTVYGAALAHYESLPQALGL